MIGYLRVLLHSFTDFQQIPCAVLSALLHSTAYIGGNNISAYLSPLTHSSAECVSCEYRCIDLIEKEI